MYFVTEKGNIPIMAIMIIIIIINEAKTWGKNLED